MTATPDYPYRKRHQGTHKFDKIDVGNLYVREDCILLGDFTFGSVATDALVLNGRVATTSLAGANIDLGSTYTYSELWEIRTKVTSWAGIGDSFSGYYFRAENGVAGSGKGLRTIEAYCVANATFSIDQIECAYFEAAIKASGAQTIARAYAVEASLAPYGGTGAITISDKWACVLLTPSGVSSRIDGTNAAKIHGIYLLARDGDGGSTKLGDGFYMGNDTSQSGTRTLTNGINIDIGCTTGVKIAGASTTAISITGAATTGISLAYVGAAAGSKAITTAGFTLNNASMGDGAGAIEADLTLTGTVAGFAAAASAWVNMASVTTGAHMICAQTNGLWSDTGGILTNGVFIFGMRADCLLETNGGAGGATFYPFSVINNTNVTTALILCNAASSDLGLVSDAGSDTNTLVPLYQDNTGIKYVKIYTHT